MSLRENPLFLYGTIILMIIVAFIIVIFRAIAAGANWTFIGFIKGTRPALSLPWAVQVILMIIVIIIGIAIAVVIHRKLKG